MNRYIGPIIITFLGLVLFSCNSEDEPEAKVANKLLVAGVTYDLNQAYVSIVPSSSSSITSYRLYFSTTGINLFDDQTSQYFEGTGFLFYTQVKGEFANNLPTDTYPPASGDDVAFYSLTSPRTLGAEDVDITTENITVTKSGDIYTIQFKATGDKGAYSLSYKGTIKIINFG